MIVEHYSFVHRYFWKLRPIRLYSGQPLASKPIGALWTSPVQSKWKWSDWHLSIYEMELPENRRVVMRLNDDEIYRIGNYEEAQQLPWRRYYVNEIFQPWWIDWNELAETHAAVWMTEGGSRMAPGWVLQADRRLWSASLHGWDCECVAILHQRAIEEVLE